MHTESASPVDGPVHVIVLAGDRGEADPLLAGTAVSSKVMLEVGGRPMLAGVLQALAGSVRAGPIHVAGPQAHRQQPLKDLAASLNVNVIWHEPGKSPADSVVRVLEQIDESCPVMLVTGDHALLQSRWVDDFVTRAGAGEGDAAVALVPWERIRQRWPESRRTRFRFSNGEYCGANLFLFASPAGRRMAGIWKRVEQDRKRPWRVVRLLGPGAVLAYLFKRMSLESGFDRLSRRFSLSVRPVILTDPEAAVDVDKPADRELVERILAERAVR